MAIGINEIESGIGLIIDGSIYQVLDYNHVKPGKGSAFVRVRIKNLKTDNVLERTYRSSETLQDVFLEERKMQYQYSAGDNFYFMDQTNYEEVIFPRSELGNAPDFLLDNLEVSGIFVQDKILKVVLPNFIIAQVMEAEPGIRGDSTRAGNKPAKIQTGAIIQVPLFINPGDWVKLDTRVGGQYIERVQK
jgi:elongation factor P